MLVKDSESMCVCSILFWSLLSRSPNHIVAHPNRSKAACDGAVIWAVKKYVNTRATRAAYGVSARVAYDAHSQHDGRSVLRLPHGPKVSGYWDPVVAKVCSLIFFIPRWRIEADASLLDGNGYRERQLRNTGSCLAHITRLSKIQSRKSLGNFRS